MSDRTAQTVNFDYQERALEFKVGDTVAPLGVQLVNGKVTGVWPAIGMVDVEWPTGHKRCPVEELVVVPEQARTSDPPAGDNTPGGPAVRSASATRVAQAWVKQSIYWAAKDRQYRATQSEINSKSYTCPKCKEGTLRKTSYKRIEGKSTKLLACPSCLFMIRVKDLQGCHLGEPCSIEDDLIEEVL